MGRLQAELASNLLNWKSSKKYGVEVYHERNSSPVSVAQNRIVKEFLSTNFDYLLLLESDLIPPPNRVCPSSALDLTEFNVNIVNGLCFICARGDPFIGMAAAASRSDGIQCSSLSEEELFPPRLIGVDCTGTGCMMIERKVFEKLEEPYFKFEFNEAGDEVVKTQDYYFSLKAKEKGFGVFVHSGFRCLHSVSVKI